MATRLAAPERELRLDCVGRVIIWSSFRVMNESGYIELRAVFGRDRGHGMLSFLWLEDVKTFVGLAISAIFTTGIVYRS